MKKYKRYRRKMWTGCGQAVGFSLILLAALLADGLAESNLPLWGLCVGLAVPVVAGGVMILAGEVR